MKLKDQSALDTYIEKKAEFDRLLIRLQELSADHFHLEPENINWSHVGDIAKYTYILRQITDTVFKQGEHVPD